MLAVFSKSVVLPTKMSFNKSEARVYSLIRRGFFLEISGSNWGARLIGEVYRDSK